MHHLIRVIASLLATSALLVAVDYGLDVRPTTPTYLGMPQTPPIGAGIYEAVPAFPHLFQGPTHICQAPRSNQLYVCEREGRIWSFENDPASVSPPRLVLDLNAPEHVNGLGLRQYCQGWDDCGLMSLAFHPEFGLAGSPHRGDFFVCYQASSVAPVKGQATDNFRPLSISWSLEAPGNSNRVARFTIPDGSFVANHATERVLIDQTDRHLWHNGGAILFHPVDGFLYITNGDEGKWDDIYQNTQRIRKNLFSGVLRIDVDGPVAGRSHAIPRQPTSGVTANYGIPDSNPFVGMTGVLEEFWAIGLRSPHRMTYDQTSDLMLLGDIGSAGRREEVNRILKGGNYQWGYKEGFLPYRSDRRPMPYTIKTAAAINATQVAVEWTAPTADTALDPGVIVVGERIRFSYNAQPYTVTAVTGWPVQSVSFTPGLASAYSVGTEVVKTTGATVTAVGSTVAQTATNAPPNDVGTMSFTVSQVTSALVVGASVSFISGTNTYAGTYAGGGTIDTHVITAISGNTITIKPPPTTSISAAKIDRNTVLGDERPPLIDFPRSGTYGHFAIIGGHVYRGTQTPDLAGKYLYADNSYGSIWCMDPTAAAPETTVTKVCDMQNYTQFDTKGGYRGLSSFGIDANGEVLLCRMQSDTGVCDTSTGQIWTIRRRTDTTTGPAIPPTLSQTGAFSAVSAVALTPAASLIPFEVNEPLWSDGASKQRWIALPNPTGKTSGFTPASEQIGYADTGEWTFPAGTVFVKHFELVDNEQTSHVRRLETRLLVRQPAGGVYGVTYKWRTDQAEADLIDAAVDEVISVTLANGSVVNRTWTYPGRADCLSCHNANAGFVLGVKTRQLNGSCAYPSTGISDNQLRTWGHIGMFAAPPAEAAIPSLTRLRHEADTTASLEVRARSFIDANCAQCHRPGGVQALFDARFDTALASQGLINGTVGSTLGIAGAKVVYPGDITRSILHVRDSSIDPAIMMPPLAKHRANDVAMTVVSEWIESLATSVSIAGATVTEGDTGSAPATLTVSIPTARSFPVSVGWSTGGGTATAGADYTVGTGTAVIAAGATSATIVITVLADALNEGDETVTVTLANPVNAILGTASATLTIQNRPAAISIASAAVTEGNAGTTNATVVVSIPLARAYPVSVDWATGGGTATPGTDYTTASGTAVIAAGTLSIVVVVPVLGDAIVEADETAQVTLTNPVNGIIATASATLTIGNDDSPPAGSGGTGGGGGGGGGCGVGGGLAALIGLLLVRLIRLRLR